MYIPRHILGQFGAHFTFARALCTCIVLLAACSTDESPTTPSAPAAPTPSFLTTDGAHNGVPRFYFLKPTVRDNPSIGVNFDADIVGLNPVVRICLASVTDCITTPVATFTRSTTPPIKKGGTANAPMYTVNWSTKPLKSQPPATYRIHVLAGANGFRRELGVADVQLLKSTATAKDVKNATTDQQIGLVAGSTLAINFWMDIKIPGSLTVSPTTATITVGATQAFTATVRDLHGALFSGTAVHWTWFSTPPTGVVVNLTPDSGLTNGSGQAMTTVTAGATPGTANVVSYTDCCLNKSATLTVESPNHDLWTTLRPMPTARFGFGLAETGGILYAIGGTNGAVNTLRLVEAYNTNTNAWTTKGVPPTSRNFLSAAAINGIIYAVGGQVEGTNGIVDASQLLEAYDPATDMWATKADMPTGRDWVGVGVVNGILYAVGGYGRNTERQELEAYNPGTDTWTSKTPMPTPRSAPGVGVINGILYVVGGYDHSTGKSVTTVEAYDPGTGTWNTTPLVPMPTPRNGFGVAVIDGILYAIGGDNNNVISAVVEAYDPATDKWTTKSSMTTPRNYSGAVGVSGIAYDVGGVNDDGVVSTVEGYTP